MRWQMILALALLVAVAAVGAQAADDPRLPLVGHWTGQSLCTNVRPACHDEQASYRVSLSKAGPNIVSIAMGKMVNGEEVLMGTLDFEVDFARQKLSAEFRGGEIHSLWTFAWNGNRLTGTLQLYPDLKVIRNVSLKKE